MRTALVALLVGLFFAWPADARPLRPSAHAPAASDTATPESKLLEHRFYRSTDGRQVHSPAHTVSGSPPAGASAECRDGTYSFSQHRRGTCSHHGGVAEWL